MAQTNERQIMTVEQMATYTGYAKSYCYWLLSQKKIASFKPTGKKGRTFLDKTDVDNFIFSNRKETTTELHQQAETFLNGGAGL